MGLNLPTIALGVPVIRNVNVDKSDKFLKHPFSKENFASSLDFSFKSSHGKWLVGMELQSRSLPADALVTLKAPYKEMSFFASIIFQVHTPRKFNSSPLKNDGWKMSFLLRLPIFRGYVEFPGCNC